MTMRAIGRAMSHSSSTSTGHTISRNPSGSFSGLRSWMAEYGIRSLGCILSLGNAAPRCTENIPQMAISYQILIRKFTPFVTIQSLSEAVSKVLVRRASRQATSWPLSDRAFRILL